MFSFKSTVLYGVLAMGLGVFQSAAQAQYPVYTNPYIPYNYNGPLYGYLSGSSEVINAQGKYFTERQRAAIVKQQAEQAKIDTRRKLFDERRYELANTPPADEVMLKTRETDLRIALRTPAVTDIWSGDALNKVLDDAIAKQGRGIKGPAIPLDEETVKKLNVSAGTNDSIGILRENSGKLTWPIPLLATEYETPRNKLDELFGTVVSQAKTNRIDRALLPAIDEQIALLRKQVRANVSELSPTDNIVAVRYLTSLHNATRVLKDANAANYFNGKWVAKGKTVDDLVRSMSQQGLRFAPAAPGAEPAYLATHAALAAYDGSLVVELKAEGAKP